MYKGWTKGTKDEGIISYIKQNGTSIVHRKS